MLLLLPISAPQEAFTAAAAKDSGTTATPGLLAPFPVGADMPVQLPAMRWGAVGGVAGAAAVRKCWQRLQLRWGCIQDLIRDGLHGFLHASPMC